MHELTHVRYNPPLELTHAGVKHEKTLV